MEYTLSISFSRLRIVDESRAELEESGHQTMQINNQVKILMF